MERKVQSDEKKRKNLNDGKKKENKKVLVLSHIKKCKIKVEQNTLSVTLSFRRKRNVKDCISAVSNQNQKTKKL